MTTWTIKTLVTDIDTGDTAKFWTCGMRRLAELRADNQPLSRPCTDPDSIARTVVPINHVYQWHDVAGVEADIESFVAADYANDDVLVIENFA